MERFASLAGHQLSADQCALVGAFFGTPGSKVLCSREDAPALLEIVVGLAGRECVVLADERGRRYLACRPGAVVRVSLVTSVPEEPGQLHVAIGVDSPGALLSVVVDDPSVPVLGAWSAPRPPADPPRVVTRSPALPVMAQRVLSVSPSPKMLASLSHPDLYEFKGALLVLPASQVATRRKAGFTCASYDEFLHWTFRRNGAAVLVAPWDAKQVLLARYRHAGELTVVEMALDAPGLAECAQATFSPERDMVVKRLVDSGPLEAVGVSRHQARG